MKRLITAGATDQTVYVWIQDSTSTTGAGKTGLVYNSAGLVCYYVRDGAAAAALTLATQTVTGAHSDGGFVEVHSTNAPGLYRLDLSDAICAAGVNNVVVMLFGATGMAPLALEIQLGGGQIATLTGHTAQTGDAFARLGAPTGASVSADIAAVQADTDNIQTRIPAALVSGRIDASVGAMAANVITDTAIAADAITDAKVASDVTIASVTGAVGSVTGNVGGNVVGSVGSVTGAVGSVTGNLGGNVTGSVGSVASGGIVAASFGAGAITSAAIATDAITSAAISTDAVSEIQSGLSTLDAAAVRTAVGMTTANLDTQLAAIQADTDDIQTRIPAALVSGRIDASVGAVAAGAITSAAIDTGAIDADALAADAVSEIVAGISVPTTAAIADAVWDEATSGHQTAGTTGKALTDAQAAGDPLSSTVPGSYASGTAGYQISRIGAAGATVTTPVTQSGDINIKRGDDYHLSDSRQIAWTFSGAPSISGATVVFKLQQPTQFTAAMTVSSSTSAYLQLTSAQTATFVLGAWNYEVQATLATSARIVTLVDGTATVWGDL